VNDLAHQNLKGPVSTLRSGVALWDGETKSWKAPLNSTMTHFRADGQIGEVEYQNSDGSICRTINDYDGAGKLKESRSRSNDGAETSSVYHYDDSSRLVRIVSIDQNGLRRDAAIYNYDPNGRKTGQIFVPVQMGNGAMAFSAGMGESDETAETVWYDIEHRFLRRLTFTRDACGRLLKEEVHLGDDVFGKIENASTEQREALMAQLTMLLGPDRVMASTSYLYDERGHQIERRTQMAGMADNRTTYTDDDRGNPVDEITVFIQREMQADETGNQHFGTENSQTSRAHYDYQYDAHGNWTERIVSTLAETSSTPQRSNVERREIGYYPNSDAAEK
jgi:hypothetical protein